MNAYRIEFTPEMSLQDREALMDSKFKELGISNTFNSSFARVKNMIFYKGTRVIFNLSYFAYLKDTHITDADYMAVWYK